MTTYTTFVPGSGVGATAGSPGAATAAYHPSSYARKPYLIEALIDFSLRNASTGDIFNCFNLPINSVVLAVGGTVVTACNGTTPVCKIGHTDDDDEWVAGSTALDATGPLALIGSGTAAPVALQVTAASKVVNMTVTVTGTISVGVVQVWMLILDTSPVRVTSTTAPNAT